MTGFNHALTGAAIGLALQNPLLVVPVAFASHFILDSLPHFNHPLYTFGNKHAWKLYALDAAIAITTVTIAITFAPAMILPILLGAVFAVLPDATLLHYYAKGKPKHWFHNFHIGIQWFERPVGILVESSYLIFVCTVIFSLKSFL